MGRSEQMTEGMQLPDTIILAKRILHPGFHYGSVWLVKESLRQRSNRGFRIPIVNTIGLNFCCDVYAVVFDVVLLSAKHQQNTYHMHLAYMTKSPKRILYVKHRRELHHNNGRVVEQLVLQSLDVRRAITKRNHLPAICIATARIEINKAKMPHSIDKIFTSHIVDFRSRKTKKREVVASNFAKLLVSFHIVRLLKQLG